MPVLRVAGEDILNGHVFVEHVSRQQPKNDAFTFRMRTVLRAIVPVARQIQEDRQEILDSFTMRDGNGKPVYVSADQMALTDPAECRRKLKALLMTEHEILVTPLTFEELKREGIKINADLAFKAGPFLLDPEVTPDGVHSDAGVEGDS